jgi:hypothetical protein
VNMKAAVNTEAAVNDAVTETVPTETATTEVPLDSV